MRRIAINEKTTQIRAFLTLIGDSFDHEEITTRLKITPDFQRFRGETVGKSNYIFDHDEWGISTEKIQSVEISDSLLPLIDRLRPCVSDMAFLAQKYSAEWHILIEVDIYKKKMPIIIFDQMTIDFIAKIKGQLGFDFFHT